MVIAHASAEVTVAVLARAPVPGQAKTRLMPALGAAGAARLHRQLVQRTLAVVREAGMPLQLWCAPSTEHRFFQALSRRDGVHLHAQPDGDIGARMQAAFEAQAGRPLLLVGSDCPALTAKHLQQAADCLCAGDDAVFTPAEDGGYVLVGLARPQPALFEAVEWSTERVMAQTRVRLKALGLRWSEMPTLWDVDTPADLARLSSAGLVRTPGR